MTDQVDFAIELKNISKSFGAVQANKNIHLKVEKGTIHGIVGENGAGKSTLMSILYGFYKADQGEIFVNGKLTQIHNSKEAIAAGIGMVHQHFMLVENFTILENVILGAEGGQMLAKGEGHAREELARLQKDYGLTVDPDAIVEDVSVGQQQRVEILKALYRGAEILILDEPTGVLTPKEVDQLFAILLQLKEQGTTIIMITHKLREIMHITDNVSVMRRGEIIADRVTKNTNPQELAELMVGRSVLLKVDKGPAEPKEKLLEIKGLEYVDEQGVKRIKGVDLHVRAGEILGIAGVSGNGQSLMLEIIAGITKASKGEMLIKGKPVDIVKGVDAGQIRDMDVAHVPEDRHEMGLVLQFEEWENSILGYHNDPKYSNGQILKPGVIRQDARDMMEKFDIRPRNERLTSAKFSGGNQQKIVIAREINSDPDILLIGQPTRGVDIGAIEYIHNQIVAMRDAGKAVLLVSVELDEILSLSDRTIVMFDGNISGERITSETNDGDLGLLMAGIDSQQQDATNKGAQ
ncbi:MAG: ABC transporter ATP-binding protein [Alphaproteobacteria bacterium]|nr:ABC transporter ATP-binding protein [Alphaproteobacteria bacterium]